MAEIKLDQLAHSYYPNPKTDDDFALKTMDYLWNDGGAYALLGPSGCGKTTLLNIISGLLVPSRGRIHFDGVDVTERTPEQRNIAQVFQFPVIYDTMTVAQNLAFPLVNRSVDSSEVDRRVKDMLDTLELTSKADQRAQGLTADEKQKISLGRGLVRYDVNAILFDEPLTVIDPQMKWQLRTKLKELHQRFDHTMIYVTHDQTEALTFADKVVVMYEGEVVQIGTPEELFERPSHTFVGYFIGSPGMNILPCSVEGNAAFVAGHRIALESFYDPPKGDRLELGVRPEFVRFAKGTEYGVPVSIEAVDDVGRHRIAKVLLGEHPLNIIVPEGETLPTFDPAIVCDPTRCSVYANDHRLEGSAQSKVVA
ncbi:MAG: ABC transporter ATP-binding protein [Gammaproteobacteria bacterium]|nr:ABC transporter ATP-binding protein [Gammaproteobacteria bacterium]